MRNGRSRPPQYRSQPIVRRVMRYECTAAQVGLTITPQKLCCSLGTVCTVTNTTVACFIGAVRVRRIQLWGMTTTSGTSASVSVNYDGTSGFAPNTELASDTINVSEYAYISGKPPANSAASFWGKFDDTDTIFTVNLPSGGIMDLDLEYIQYDEDNGVNVFALSSGSAILGSVYYIRLFPASNALGPYSLTTTW